MADASTYTPEFRMETADYALSTGKPIVQVASELGINDKTLQRWVQIRRKQLSGEYAIDAESAELKEARKRGYVAENAIFHSDRGSQYTSRKLALWARVNHVRLSVGRTGSCHDNAVAESFFATLKRYMYAEGKSYKTRFDARNYVVEFIESFYNRRKPHTSIGNQIPAVAMKAFFDRARPVQEEGHNIEKPEESSSTNKVVQAA